MFGTLCIQFVKVNVGASLWSQIGASQIGQVSAFITKQWPTNLIINFIYFESEFEEMAIGVLTLFDKSTDDIINGVILLRKIPFYNLDCLQMAVEADCQKFVSLSCVQNLLTDIWYGKIQIKSGLRGKIWVNLVATVW